LRTTQPQWPDDASLALSTIVSLSYFEDIPPEGSVRPLDLAGGAGLPPVRPQYAQLSTREYGLRVGFFRLAKALESVGITPAVAIDVMTAEQYPFLVEFCLDRGYELIDHGMSATQPITSNMDDDAEALYLEGCIERFTAATGQMPAGWFSPSWSESTRTPALLRNLGLQYLCDWPNDEQPYLMTGEASGMVSLPMMFEFDDNYSFVVRNQMVANYADGLRRAASRMVQEGQLAQRFLGLSLSAWISGQGWRVGAIAQALGEIVATRGVVVAQPSDIASWTVTAASS
jgi:hypothetical protein